MPKLLSLSAPLPTLPSKWAHLQHESITGLINRNPEVVAWILMEGWELDRYSKDFYDEKMKTAPRSFARPATYRYSRHF